MYCSNTNPNPSCQKFGLSNPHQLCNRQCCSNYGFPKEIPDIILIQKPNFNDISQALFLMLPKKKNLKSAMIYPASISYDFTVDCFPVSNQNNPPAETQYPNWISNSNERHPVPRNRFFRGRFKSTVKQNIKSKA